MKVVILCGGLGTRLREETEFRPKPMVPIGEQPILWHIIKHFAHYGHHEFFLALGYKGEIIKAYFQNYHAMSRDVSIDLATGRVTARGAAADKWKVHLLDTGAATNTGGRVRRLRGYLEGEPFLLTYGDGVSDVDLDALVAFHKKEGKMITLTAVQPAPRFGALTLHDNLVSGFAEKRPGSDGWVNAGFMVVEPTFFRYLESDDTGLEILAKVAADGEVAAYRHNGFWQCMDTLRDKETLEKAWATGHPPWKIWT